MDLFITLDIHGGIADGWNGTKQKIIKIVYVRHEPMSIVFKILFALCIKIVIELKVMPLPTSVDEKEQRRVSGSSRY